MCKSTTNAGSRQNGIDDHEPSGRPAIGSSLAYPDGGCPNCGPETTAVDLSDFGPDRGQLCPDCGIVFAATEGFR